MTAASLNDFTSGEDVIGIAGLGIGFEDLSFSDSDEGAIISANGSDLGILSNANADFIADEANFVFV